jgi:hypothetical protein
VAWPGVGFATGINVVDDQYWKGGTTSRILSMTFPPFAAREGRARNSPPTKGVPNRKIVLVNRLH